MSDSDPIARTEAHGQGPVTTEWLVDDLRALGLRPESVVIVHSSLRSLGWVSGGPTAVVDALLEVIGPEGTLVVPAHSGDLSDPARWEAPPVPVDWHATIRSTMPAYDPARTPTRRMGAIAEAVRTMPGALRSAHPQVSVAAVGPQAAHIVEPHDLTNDLGDPSPMGRLHGLDADILLLGVGHGNNTMLHLAEHRAEWSGKTIVGHGAPMTVDGRRTWVTWDDIDPDDGDFEQLGADYERGHPDAVTVGPVGLATARHCRARHLVEYATEWISTHR